MDLITFELELAFRKEGCPVCRLRSRDEARYISSFLWEFVNDPGIRVHLVNALGFCREHAWLRWLRLNSASHPHVAFPAGLVPSEGCRVCQIGRKTEQTLEWLVKHCAEEEFRGWYRASDGLCLPHLRGAHEIAESQKTRVFLIDTAEEKLGTLAGQLREYLRKHNWDYRDEPKLSEEQSSWIRAVEFFVGKP